MSAPSLSALRTTRRAMAGALALSLFLPLPAQEPTPAPTRLENLATQARILAHLLERELGPTRELDAWDSIYNSLRLRHAPTRDTTSDPATGENEAAPRAGDAGRVIGEEPPSTPPEHALTYGDYRQAWLSALTARESARKLHALRSAAIPGSGALLWMEVDLPSSRVHVSSSPEDDGDPARAAWDRARRELEGHPPSAKGEARPAAPLRAIVDPGAEAGIVRSVEKVVLAHAARLEALEAGESITIVLTLRTATALDRLLLDGRRHSSVESFLEAATRGTSGSAAGGPAPRAAEIVRVLRCPRVAPGSSAPQKLETVARYEQR